MPFCKALWRVWRYLYYYPSPLIKVGECITHAGCVLHQTQEKVNSHRAWRWENWNMLLNATCNYWYISLWFDRVIFVFTSFISMFFLFNDLVISLLGAGMYGLNGRKTIAQSCCSKRCLQYCELLLPGTWRSPDPGCSLWKAEFQELMMTMMNLFVMVAIKIINFQLCFL